MAVAESPWRFLECRGSGDSRSSADMAGSALVSVDSFPAATLSERKRDSVRASMLQNLSDHAWADEAARLGNKGQGHPSEIKDMCTS